MTIRKPTYKKTKASVEAGEYDPEFSAMLFFMYRAGLLKAYPLNPLLYPDNEETERVLSVAFLKLKLRNELSGFQSRMVCKSLN